jgi:AraC-like DNA-binding protein
MSDHELRVLFETDLLRVEDFRCSGTPVAHSDEECAEHHEIVFPRSGTFVRYDASGVTLADVNQILFFHRDQPYQISHPISGGDCSTVFRLMPAVLFDLLRACDPAADDKPDRPFPVSHTIVDTRHRLLQYHLLHTALNDQENDALEIEECLLMLLAEVIQHTFRLAGLSIPSPATRSHRELTYRVKLVLAERFREKLTLHEIAAAVHYSPYFLCRVFKNEIGLSIHLYVQRIRLLHALDQLAECPTQDLTELSLNLGFSSQSHFSSAFASRFGMAPSEFRRHASRRSLEEMSKILKA